MSMYPIISIVGKSESGKTTLLEGLIALLKRRGHRVAIIKHSGEDFEFDKTGKDSWRFSRAGSNVAAIISTHKLAIIRQIEHDPNPQELSHFIAWDCDIVLTEGFKHNNFPKIEVHRKEQGPDLVSTPEQLLAVVTDEPLAVDVPQFSRNEVEKITSLIENTLLAQQKEDDIDLLINDVNTPTSPSFRNLLTKTLIAMVSGLKGAGQVKNLNISLRRKLDI
ncbi:molybdopterin-guanine dinucleotide biosynthesis protein B [Chloroflexota bacterium]